MLFREDVPKEFTWSVEDLFASLQDFENAKITILQKKQALLEVFDELNCKKEEELLDFWLALIVQYEDLTEHVERYISYINLQTSVDATNVLYTKLASEARSFITAVYSEISGFTTTMSKLELSFLKELHKKDPSRAGFWRTLIRKRKSLLSDETEQTLITLKESFELPYQAYETLKLADMTFPDFTYDGVDHELSYARFENHYQAHPITGLRRKAFKVFTEGLKEYGNSFALYFEAEVKYNIAMAKVRNYNNVFEYLLDEQEVSVEHMERQLHFIMEDLAPIMRRYARLIKKTYHLGKLHFSDLLVSLFPTLEPKINKEEAEQLVMNALAPLGDKYTSLVKRCFEERWIDWAENRGKSTGGFCSSPYGTHSYILLSWTNQMAEMFTLIHEIGHAIHFTLTHENNPSLNCYPSLYLIEAPSTMNELFLTQHLIKTAKNEGTDLANRKALWFCHMMIASTYYHNMVTHGLEAVFQREAYLLAMKGQALDFETLCHLKMEVLRRFWGDEVDIDEEAGVTWMRQPHYYMSLYPYTYSAGLALGTSVALKWMSGDKEILDKWLKVLSSGASYTPKEFVEQLGMSLDDKEILEATTTYVDYLVTQLEEGL